MANGDVTNWELARRLDRIDGHLANIEKNFDENISKLRHRDNNLDQRVTTASERLVSHTTRLDKLEALVNKILWAVLVIFGVLILESIRVISNLAGR